MTAEQVTPQSAPNRSMADTIGWLLVRLVVPIWVLTGAIFKLIYWTPTALPGTIQKIGNAIGFDLYVLLAVLIGLEFFAAGVMLFIGRHARAMAIFMLTIFVVILIAEMASGATSCGCLGSVSPPPWVMLAIDGLMLAGILVTMVLAGRSIDKRSATGAIGWGLASLLTIGGFVAGFVRLQEEVPTVTAVTPVAGDPSVNPSPQVPDRYYMSSGDISTEWIGKPWRELELFTFMTRWPTGLDAGRTHVIFYGRNCDHCEEMFWDDLVGSLDTPVVVVEVPSSKDQLRMPGFWDLPETTDVVHMDPLPLGYDWIMTTPVVVTIEDGVVICAEEGDHVTCFEMAPSAPSEGDAPAGAGSSAAPAVDPTFAANVNPAPKTPSRYWYASDEEMEAWVGKPWREAEVFTYMQKWPSNMDAGKRHVIFYRRSCEHCEEMFLDDLSGDLAIPVSVVEIPESKTALRDEYPWPMPETTCEHVDHLPVGYDWIVTTPLIVSVEDGVITCVKQGDHQPCFEE